VVVVLVVVVVLLVGVGSNVAVQIVSAFIASTPSLQSESPPNPAKLEPGSAAAAKVTVVPAAKCALQSGPQSIAAGLLVTLPRPAPARFTAAMYGPPEPANAHSAAVHCA
jgi:hypothetical protein